MHQTKEKLLTKHFIIINTIQLYSFILEISELKVPFLVYQRI